MDSNNSLTVLICYLFSCTAGPFHTIAQSVMFIYPTDIYKSLLYAMLWGHSSKRKKTAFSELTA